MPSLATRRKVLLAEIESTYNTDPVPTAADNAVLVENLQWASANLRMLARPAVRPSLAALRQVYGGRLLSVTCDVNLKGSGALGVAPDLGVLLRACGIGETIVASTSVAYSPVSTGHESITMYVYEDGRLVPLTGCRGTWSLNTPVGEFLKLSLTITGHEGTHIDATLVDPTLDSTVPETFRGAGFTVDSFAAKIANFSFDLGNVMSMPPNPNAADGFGEIQIVDRDVNGSIDPLEELVADEDYIGNFKSGAAMALTTGAIGSTAGNIVTITMPAVSYRDSGRADRDGLVGLNLPFGAHESTTDDDFTITLT